jgi:hypothetical protein
MYELSTVPTQFHRYIDTNHVFNIIDCYNARSVTVVNDQYHVSPYIDKKILLSGETYFIFPKSIFLTFLVQENIKHILIPVKSNIRLYQASRLLFQAKHTGPREQKYLTLYKAYESLTRRNERNLIYSSIRHGLSHSPADLTKPKVVKTLIELFGEVEIDAYGFRHRKVLYINYWGLLKEVDRLIKQEIDLHLLGSKQLINNISIAK